MKTKDLYRLRFDEQDNLKRCRIWKYLCSSFFNKYISKSDTVIDIGAGYCEFINNISCKKKIAVDFNPDVKRSANKDIDILNMPFDKIPQKYNANVDVIFMSNFLEHLNTKEDVLAIFAKANKLLKKGGKVMILQPNIDLVKEKYWNFIDHKIPLNIPSLTEALNHSGFKIVNSIYKFLPYTTKSFLPQSVFLLKIYLLLPEFLRPFAGQSLIYAQKVN